MWRSMGVLAACAALLVPAVSACGGGGSGSGEDKIVFGFVGALTGPLSSSGIAARAGAEVAVDKANQAGGQGGPKVELIVRDTGGDATKAVAATRELAQKGVQAIYFTTESMPAVQDVLNQSKILGLGPGTGPILAKLGESKTYKWGFSVGDNDGDPAVQPLVDYASKHATGGIVGQLNEASAYGKAQVEITKSLVSRSYPNIRLVNSDFPTGATSVTRQLNGLRSQGANALIAWTYGAGLVQTMKSVGESGYKGVLVGPKAMGDPAVIAAAPKEVLAKSVGGPLPKTFLADGDGQAPSGAAGEFVQGYKAKRGKQTFSALDQVGAYGFDAVTLVRTAADKAGSTDPAEIKKVLMSGQRFAGAQGNYVYGPDKRLGLSPDQLGLFQPSFPCDAGTCRQAAVG
ncbi:branched-chain amino acid ABC transporter substrate-binding protein [Actinomadura sp. NBRC 104412]|uniref:ABC transporter substrate-binding protein n=1 Tax=Actinomadura sp. NBRC 104412 TaxID=3032203 RepID=UPI0024A0ADFE|nr:ABC transporter substrate-binding protein [Actinomadura sp. NBRC 104412]GLZ06188.1 branched-chain amino acid ABC transporter substrate-binding protein [Actinomadura sp. NBRC 104412]